VTVSLGTGQSDYESIPHTDGKVELIFGPQGGYHIWGRARFQGFAPDVDIAFKITRMDDLHVYHAPTLLHRWIENGVARGLVPLPGGEFMTNAEQVVVSITCSNELVGRHILFQVFVTERATGRTVTDSRDVMVVDNDPSPACRDH
jgi:hypothetical protein